MIKDWLRGIPLFDQLIKLKSITQKKLAFKVLEESLRKTRYSEKSFSTKVPAVIFMIDDYTPDGGLVDKLKGIVSGKLLADKLGVAFYIYSKHNKFPINRHLNTECDLFLTDENKIAFDTSSKPLFIYNYLPKRLDVVIDRINNFSQIHFYCNMDLTLIMFSDVQYRKLAWATAFKEIFSFPKSFASVTQGIFANNGVKIAFHLRFVSLLGDFEDSGSKRSLNKDAKLLLMTSCRERILEMIINENETCCFFVFSDSITFLEFMKGDPQLKKLGKEIIVNTDYIAHTGLNQSDAIMQRTLIDFYALTSCDKIYQILGQGMHNSDFSRYASYINGSRFEVIKL